jgi:hypothetical protein
MRIMDEIVFSGFARRTAASASDFARVVRNLILDYATAIGRNCPTCVVPARNGAPTISHG